jgi:CHAD domain-containing protein
LLSGAFPADEADAAYATVEAVQKDLGEINDSVTLLAALRDRMRKSEDPQVFDRIRAILAAEEADLEQSRTKFLTEWPERGDTLRQLLDRLVVQEPVLVGAS